MSLSPVVRQILAGLSADELAHRPDADLLARFIANREEAAFAVLVERHGPAVLGVCRRMLGHLQDTEDAAQAVFLVLARNARRVRKPEAIAAWLHGVAVRVSRKALSRRRKTEPLPKLMPASKPLQDATWADARRVIDEALAAMPDSLRVPLVLCYLEGLTRDEAASRLGVPLDTFRGRLERGREKLRAALARARLPACGRPCSRCCSNRRRAPLPEWVNKTASLACGSSSVPSSIASLTAGILPVKLSQYWVVGGVFATLALIGVVSAAGSAPPPEAPSPRAAAPIAADEPVPLLPKDRTGVWRSVVISKNGNKIEPPLDPLHRWRTNWSGRLHWRSPGDRCTEWDLATSFVITAAGKLVLTPVGDVLSDGIRVNQLAEDGRISASSSRSFPLDKECRSFQLVRDDARGLKSSTRSFETSRQSRFRRQTRSYPTI